MTIEISIKALILIAATAFVLGLVIGIEAKHDDSDPWQWGSV